MTYSFIRLSPDGEVLLDTDSSYPYAEAEMKTLSA